MRLDEGSIKMPDIDLGQIMTKTKQLHLKPKSFRQSLKTQTREMIQAKIQTTSNPDIEPRETVTTEFANTNQEVL